jgi:hypothetical protein
MHKTKKLIPFLRIGSVLVPKLLLEITAISLSPVSPAREEGYQRRDGPNLSEI